MPHKLYQVDAFTHEPFKGNPAAVCLLEGPEPDEWMQNLAAEMNLSETAFLLPEEDAWGLRWFTPTTEVDLCGHATLASASVLFEIHPQSRAESLVFHTRSGELKARWSDGAVELDFPAMTPEPLTIPSGMAEILGVQFIGGVFSGDFYLFETENAQQIKDAAPDFTALKALPMPEVIITAKSDDPHFDFISRFFAPQLGVDEDPVTGSAHCLLAPYWAQKLGKTEMKAFQASQRGGQLDVRLEGERVRITGGTRFIFEADLLV